MCSKRGVRLACIFRLVGIQVFGGVWLVKVNAVRGWVRLGVGTTEGACAARASESVSAMGSEDVAYASAIVNSPISERKIMKTGAEQKAKEDARARQRAIARWETEGGKISSNSEKKPTDQTGRREAGSAARGNGRRQAR